MAALEESTGKSQEEWIRIIEGSSARKHGEIMAYLKNEHGVSYGFANTIAHKFNKSDAGSFEDIVLVENQYKGKEALIPVYELLMSEITLFGDDVKVAPKKDSVSLIRKKQFALIKPATKTRIDLGLKFKNKPFEGKLENSGPFGTMCTHRIQISSTEDVDAQVLAWIREAYDESV